MEIEVHDLVPNSLEGTVQIELEYPVNIPFEIKRVYYIFNTQSIYPRGFHAQKDSLQMLICLKGSCELRLDDGKEKSSYNLNRINQGVFIDKLIWHEMHEFTEDCLLMVLSNDYYNEEDNIRNYKDFLEISKSPQKAV
ncbi:sugar 3,4-ketoisomerase [Sporosarcina siberiensis]|uniref:Sugar 3,4-ketoisomerase n=1 Tax=Sporosarcina siberiensis TaxID=1365606 RepID=A0ABW4SDE6_9BACL